MNFRIQKFVSMFVGCVCSLATVYSQSIPNVFVPESSVRKPTGKTWTAHTNYLIYTGKWRRGIFPLMAQRGPLIASSVQGYAPSDIKAAYNLPDTGGSQAIAVIDAFDIPTSLKDFNVFSKEFGLPTETSTTETASSNQVLQVVYPGGSKPATNASWGGEIDLDIEWAHAVAPNAKIYLVEAASANLSDLVTAVNYVTSNLPDVREVTMSFGANESSTETLDDSAFTGSNIVYLAAAGDSSNQNNYPACSPNVIGVGGTSLNVGNGLFESETAWNGGGGGLSPYESRPAFQNSVQSVVGSQRGSPDIAADADPNTGCAVYDSTKIPGNGAGWLVYGGTSLATPICAGILNLRGAFATNTFAELTKEYADQGTSFIRDIISGSSGTFTAGPGYDLVTGIGVPIGVYTDHVYTPSSVTVTEGVALSGIPDEMAVLDGHDYIVRSVATSLTEQQIEISGTFATTLTSSVAPLSTTLSITGTTGNAANVLMLFNVTTQNWDTVATIGFGFGNSTFTFGVSNIGNYIGSNGAIQFQLLCSEPGVTLPAPFEIGIDQLMLTIVATS